jgi:hypothetical protein
MSTLKFLKFFSIGLMCGTSLCFATDIIQENKDGMPLKISLKSIEIIEKEDLSLLDQKAVNIGSRNYRLNIHDTVRDAVLSGVLSKEKLQEALSVIENKKPNEKVVGYALDLYKGKICITPFLGNNAD